MVKSNAISSNSEPAAKLGAIQNAYIGSLAGMTEVILQQPSIAIKNAIQQGRNVNWAPTALYRGVGVTLGAVAPCTAIQFAVNGKLLSLYKGNAIQSRNTASEGDLIKIGCAIAAGCTSAIVGAPAELVMTVQQNNGKGFRETFTHLLREHGTLRIYRGFTLMAARESIWCASYLALSPIIINHLHIMAPKICGNREDATGPQVATAVATGSILTGLLTLYATQPIDTLKTVMQGEALRPEMTLSNTASSIRKLHREGGIWAFYRGSLPRGIRLIGSVFILGQTKVFLENLLRNDAIMS